MKRTKQGNRKAPLRARKSVTPAYERDDGPLTKEQLEAIERLQPRGRMKVSKRLCER
jgi:hypothetical protein